MKLTKHQKEVLEAFKKSEAFSILKDIEAEQFNKLGQVLLSEDIDDPKVVEKIKTNKIYIKARQDFLSNVNKHCKGVYEPKI